MMLLGLLRILCSAYHFIVQTKGPGKGFGNALGVDRSALRNAQEKEVVRSRTKGIPGESEATREGNGECEFFMLFVFRFLERQYGKGESGQTRRERACIRMDERMEDDFFVFIYTPIFKVSEIEVVEGVKGMRDGNFLTYEICARAIGLVCVAITFGISFSCRRHYLKFEDQGWSTSTRHKNRSCDRGKKVV